MRKSTAVDLPGRQPLIRKVNGYLIYVEDILGIGQYGKVCKAQLASEVKQANSKMFACKIIEITCISQEDYDCIQKEVRLHNMVKSENCVRLYQTIKTNSNIYMMQDFCNGFDLAVLLRLRKRLTQKEVSLILRQVVAGAKDVWAYNIIHRDMKLANILLHFPENPELASMSRN